MAVHCLDTYLSLVITSVLLIYISIYIYIYKKASVRLIPTSEEIWIFLYSGGKIYCTLVPAI